MDSFPEKRSLIVTLDDLQHFEEPFLDYLLAKPKISLLMAERVVKTFMPPDQKVPLHVRVDTLPQNNEVMATVQVSGSPRVLYVEGQPGQARHLSTALRGDDIEVDVVSRGDMPATLAEMRSYACIILSDVPAHDLTSVQQQALHAYVRDLGRGFVMIGGENSFGVGGYYKTPVEDLLPVNMDLEDKKHFPTLAMVMAIDRSGSASGAGRSAIWAA